MSCLNSFELCRCPLIISKSIPPSLTSMLAACDSGGRSSKSLECALRRLCERQTKSGGLNGRPEKLQDVCYSWWCLSALAILDRLHWIDRDALCAFILQCQVLPLLMLVHPVIGLLSKLSAFQDARLLGKLAGKPESPVICTGFYGLTHDNSSHSPICSWHQSCNAMLRSGCLRLQ